MDDSPEPPSTTQRSKWDGITAKREACEAVRLLLHKYSIYLGKTATLSDTLIFAVKAADEKIMFVQATSEELDMNSSERGQ